MYDDYDDISKKLIFLHLASIGSHCKIIKNEQSQNKESTCLLFQTGFKFVFSGAALPGSI